MNLVLFKLFFIFLEHLLNGLFAFVLVNFGSNQNYRRFNSVQEFCHEIDFIDWPWVKQVNFFHTLEKGHLLFTVMHPIIVNTWSIPKSFVIVFVNDSGILRSLPNSYLLIHIEKFIDQSWFANWDGS